MIFYGVSGCRQILGLYDLNRYLPKNQLIQAKDPSSSIATAWLAFPSFREDLQSSGHSQLKPDPQPSFKPTNSVKAVDAAPAAWQPLNPPSLVFAGENENGRPRGFCLISNNALSKLGNKRVKFLLKQFQVSSGCPVKTEVCGKNTREEITSDRRRASASELQHLKTDHPQLTRS